MKEYKMKDFSLPSWSHEIFFFLFTCVCYGKNNDHIEVFHIKIDVLFYQQKGEKNIKIISKSEGCGKSNIVLSSRKTYF